MEALVLILVLILWTIGLGLHNRAESEKSVGNMALASIMLIGTLFSAFAGLSQVYGHVLSLDGLIIIICFSTFIFVMGFVKSLRWLKAKN